MQDSFGTRPLAQRPWCALGLYDNLYHKGTILFPNLLFFWPFRSVFGTTLAPFGHTGRVQVSSDNVIPYTGQVLDSAASDQHNTMFLKVVADAGDVSGDFNPIGQTDSCNFSQSGIRFFRRDGLYRNTHASLLRSFDVRRLSPDRIQPFEQRRGLGFHRRPNPSL